VSLRGRTPTRSWLTSPSPIERGRSEVALAAGASGTDKMRVGPLALAPVWGAEPTGHSTADGGMASRSSRRSKSTSLGGST
jgi:hypothetical protein